MTLQEVFDYLQDHKVFTLELPDKHAAESLRVMLVKKWGKYKQGLDDLGFLDDKTKYMSMTMKEGEIAEDMSSQKFTFQLKPRTRSQVEYKILKPGDDNAS